MLKKITNKLKVLALLIAIIFTTNSCSDLTNNPLQDKETGENLSLLLLDLNVFDTKINVHLINEVTGDYITDDGLTITFAGKDADKLVDPSGKKKTDFSVKNGILEVALDPSFTPTEESPIEFTVFVSSDGNKWTSLPQEASITHTENTDIVINLNVAEKGEDFTGDVNEFKAFELKSANVNNLAPTEAPFKVSINCPGGITKVTYDPVRTDGAYDYYYHLAPTAWSLSKTVSFEVKNYTGGNIFADYGFAGWRWIGNNCGWLGNTNGTFSKTYNQTNTKNFNFWASTKRASLRCSKGISVSIVESNNKPGSAEFDYKLTFADGTTKTGKISGGFRASNRYTIKTTISPIYYPGGKENAKLEITTKGTYTLDKTVLQLNTLCGAKADFKVTPKVGLKAYAITTSIGCQEGGVGAAPTMRGTVSGPGLTGDVPFTFSGGTATLNLLPNEDYTVSGTYNGTSASFGLTTKKDQASINKVIANTKSSYPELYNLTLSVSDNSISIGVVFTTKDCPF